ncbi:hypothetical protein [Marinobacter sp.]|uniref:hypothetical protein n=2 Tax=Marinobacter sp. TaxID=50741 RepID=UPI003BABC24B
MMSGIWQRTVILVGLSLFLVGPSTVFASDDLDVTMRMVTDDEDLTESVVREINLREPVSLGRPSKDRGVDKSVNSADKARDARDARERGREAANAASERAREVRNDNGRKGRPELPGLPDVSNRPDRP